MNTTFYKKLHEDCEENQKFYWLLERSKFSRSFLARKGKETDKILQLEIKKKNWQQSRDGELGEQQTSQWHETKICKFYPLIF